MHFKDVFSIAKSFFPVSFSFNSKCTINKFTTILNMFWFFSLKPLPKNMVSRLCDSKKVCAAADMQLQVLSLFSNLYMENIRKIF